MDNNQQIVHFDEIYDSPMVEIGETVVDETGETHDMNDPNIEHVPEVECGEVVIITGGQENGEVEINSFQNNNLEYSQLSDYGEIIIEPPKIPNLVEDERERRARIFEASQPIHDDSFSDESQPDYSYERIKITQPLPKRRGRPPGSLNKNNTKVINNKLKPKKIIIKREQSVPLSLSDDSVSTEEEIIYQNFKCGRRKEPKKRAFRHR